MNFVLGRYVHDDIHPFALSLLRWLGVVILLIPYIFYQRKRILDAFKKHFFILFVFSILGVTCFNTFLYYGLQDTTATNALLINSSIPILIIGLNAIINKESISKLQFLGIILSTVGVIFLVVKGEFSNLLTLQFNQGDFWIILSSFVWALYCILLKYKPHGLKPFEFISIISLIGVVFLIFAYPFFVPNASLKDFSLDSNVYGVILFMVIFPSLLSFYFWNRGILEIGANKTGQFTHLMPIFGAILAYAFLDEVLKPYHIYGIVCIALGIYLSLFYTREVK